MVTLTEDILNEKLHFLCTDENTFLDLTMMTELLSFNHLHCVKSVRIRSFSIPYFLAFELNMERYGVPAVQV